MVLPITLKLPETGRGAFVIEDAGKILARMDVGVADGRMTVYHTEVSDQLKGRGVAMDLLSTMVNYAREKKLRVVALCPFVHAQFKRNPEKYADIWDRHPRG